MKQKYNKGFTQVNEVLSKKIKNQKLEKSFYKYQALKHWEKVSSGFLGQGREQAKAVDLRNGVLVVACLTQELAYQIKLLADRIINELNQLIGQRVVFAIYVES